MKVHVIKLPRPIGKVVSLFLGVFSRKSGAG